MSVLRFLFCYPRSPSIPAVLTSCEQLVKFRVDNRKIAATCFELYSPRRFACFGFVSMLSFLLCPIFRVSWSFVSLPLVLSALLLSFSFLEMFRCAENVFHAVLMFGFLLYFPFESALTFHVEKLSTLFFFCKTDRNLNTYVFFYSNRFCWK